MSSQQTTWSTYTNNQPLLSNINNSTRAEIYSKRDVQEPIFRKSPHVPLINALDSKGAFSNILLKPSLYSVQERKGRDYVEKKRRQVQSARARIEREKRKRRIAFDRPYHSILPEQEQLSSGEEGQNETKTKLLFLQVIPVSSNEEFLSYPRVEKKSPHVYVKQKVEASLLLSATHYQTISNKKKNVLNVKQMKEEGFLKRRRRMEERNLEHQRIRDGLRTMRQEHYKNKDILLEDRKRIRVKVEEERRRQAERRQNQIESKLFHCSNNMISKRLKQQENSKQKVDQQNNHCSNVQQKREEKIRRKAQIELVKKEKLHRKRESGSVTSKQLKSLINSKKQEQYVKAKIKHNFVRGDVMGGSIYERAVSALSGLSQFSTSIRMDDEQVIPNSSIIYNNDEYAAFESFLPHSNDQTDESTSGLEQIRALKLAFRGDRSRNVSQTSNHSDYRAIA